MGTFILIFILFFVVFNIIPKYPYIKVSKATGLINEGKYEEGLELFSKVLKNKNVDFMTKIRYVFTELKFGSLTKAKEGISYILAEPKLARGIRYEAKAVFALILYKEGSLDDAKELMSEVYENYKNTNMYCTLGYLYNVLETPEEAVSFNLEAYEFNSSHHTVRDNLGQAYYLNGEYDKAEEIYKSLIEENPKFPEPYYNYALVLIKKGDREYANELLSEALAKPFNNLTTVTKEEIKIQIERINPNE
jgi:tetratricopeptide (TPR) repeat protein